LIDPKRQAVLDEAATWLGTPFHHEARVKGHGVDCGQILLAIYETVGLIPHVETEHYPADFHLHRDREWYAEILGQHATEFSGPPDGEVPLPADIVLFKFGRVHSHGAIVVAWPRLIHAYFGAGRVCWGDATLQPLADRPRRFFRPHFR
jgi:cell wall-associated NlpC family hydrolase